MLFSSLSHTIHGSNDLVKTHTQNAAPLGDFMEIGPHGTMKTKHLLTRRRKNLPYNMTSSYNAKNPKDFKVLMSSKH